MIKIANDPCPWGALEFELEGEASGYTRFLESKAAGDRGTEIGNPCFLPTDPGLLREELQERNLEKLGMFVPVDFSNGYGTCAG
jgi:inosose dehydratase